MNQPGTGTDNIRSEIRGSTGFITLDRPAALNALNLPMVRALSRLLQDWQRNPDVRIVALRGNSRQEPFGVFCAGGDIRFLHHAACSGNPEMEDFFTEEYRLDHLLHRFGKPCIAFMDGFVMGGGMGISQGASLRVVTENTRMAMPETGIGMIPDVGAGWFLSRTPGHTGEYLALLGQVIGAGDAVAFGLADGAVAAADLPALWEGLAIPSDDPQALLARLRGFFRPMPAPESARREQIDRIFGQAGVDAIAAAMATEPGDWAAERAAALARCSPLLLHVTLEQIRRGRQLSLADNFRLERGLMRHCFHLQRAGQLPSEAIEGIRALSIDKDRQPRWQPDRIDKVDPAEVAAFFQSPWPADVHPLAMLD